MIKKRNFKSIVAVGVIALAFCKHFFAACGSKSTSSKDEITGTPLLKY